MATKYTLCLGGLSATSQPQSINSSQAITYNGFSYDSVESFDANNMPRHLILDKPNVVVAYAGTKKVNGVDTGIPCVIVGVSSKDPNISSSDMIPSTLPDGVITDIIEVPKIVAFGTCTNPLVTTACAPHGDQYRPLMGGISAIEESGTACTLGLVVKDSSDGSLVALTNNHCAGLLYDPGFDIPVEGNSSTAGMFMLQPSPSDGGLSPADRYGSVKRAVAMQFGVLGSNSVDCAISTVGVDDASTAILEVNDGPFDFAGIGEYNVGTEITKSGRTTGIIEPPLATITSMASAVNVAYGPDTAQFVNQIIYSSLTTSSLGGDSGAAVLAEIGGSMKVVGLNFAGNASGTLGVANHINTVASQLNVVAWNGDIVVSNSASNSIMVSGECYSRVGDTLEPISHIVDTFFASCEECSGLDDNSSSESSNSSSSHSSSSESSSTENMSSSSDSSSSTVNMSTSSDSSSSTVGMSTSSDSSSSTVNMSSSSDSSSSNFDPLHSVLNTIITNFNISINADNSISLDWREVEGASGYVLERKDGFSDYDVVSDGTDLSFVDYGVVPGLFYSYSVRAYYTYSESERDQYDSDRAYGSKTYSDAVVFAPLAPSDLIVSKSSRGLYLSWIDNSSYEDGFVIQRFSPDDSEWNTIYYSRNNVSFFTDENISSEGEYKYRIKSFINLNNEDILYSLDSNEDSYIVELTNVFEFKNEGIFIEAGDTKDISVDYNSSLDISVVGLSTDEIFWFLDNQDNTISSAGNKADIYINSARDFSVKIEQQGSSSITTLNVSVEYEDLRRNPMKPINIKSRLSGGLLGLLTWSSLDSNVSHFNIYRTEGNANSIIEDGNIVGVVPGDIGSLFNFIDYSLSTNTSYSYTVIAISIIGKTSEYNGSIYVGYDISELSTDDAELFIFPTEVLVSPNSSVALLSSEEALWSFYENNSGSELLVDGISSSATYTASDKWGARDIVKIESNGKTAFSSIIITEII
jgi:hypothetical protein